MSAYAELDPPAQEFRARASEPVSAFWIFGLLLRERRTVLGMLGVGLAIALVVAVMRQPTYTTNFSFIPQSSQDPRGSGLASLAGQFGVSIGAMGGQGQSPQFYADLLGTREILEPIARDSFSTSTRAPRRPLPDLLEISAEGDAERTDDTIRRLRERVVKSTVATRTTGVVSVSVKTDSPLLSQSIAERLVREVERFNLVTRQTQAAAERRFVEGRLQEARRSLRVAENALQGFLQQNRVVGSPELVLQQQRLQTDVDIQRQLVMGLVQQYEEARIREVRDTPVITVIERPTLAARPDPRKRLVTLATGAFTALLVAASYLLSKDALSRRRAAGA